ncbi:MAG: aminotransferase class IV [Anaerolineae bacterium]|nr:aminotransferase class IV [Anaerolineae bacterium]
MIFDYAILNGALLPVGQAQIPIFNKALFSSFGVYETVKVDRGRPFYLEEYLCRLFNSARMIELDLGVEVDTLAGWFRTLLRTDPQATWTMRVLALGDVGDGVGPIIGMWPEPLPIYPASLYREGSAAILYQGRRAIPACKSLNTLVNYLARRAAVRVGALEGLLYHDGHLTEGARSNIFAVCQGQLMTPPSATVLSGITRDVILQVMADSAWPVVETSVPVEVSLYDELFISSTSMHVIPVTQIEGQPVGDGRVGPVTQIVMERFAAHYRQTMDLIAG